MSDKATVHAVKRTGAIACQVSYEARVSWPEEPVETVTFVGPSSEYGPVVMITPAGAQTFVTDPGRFGPFGADWVRQFFA